MPKNKAWNSLVEKHNVEFSDYGNWSGSLLQAEPEDILTLVIFLDDLIDLRSRDLTGLQVILKNFYNLLENHLNRARSPTIVCFACVHHYDVIRNSKVFNQKEIAHRIFFDEARVLTDRYQQLYLIDLDRLFGWLGHNWAYDQRNWYIAHCRLSSKGLSVLADGVSDILNRVSEAASKALVLDCDNTLWGGVIGEDGIEGLVLGQDGLGQAYVDFQLAIKDLSAQGVIIVLASKNNEDEVWEVFDNHRSMKLNRSDIVSWKINWDEKYENIQALADELDLSLDAFVFWDDNPVEREKMKLVVPQVFTVDAHADVFEWPNQLSQLEQFAKFSITKDDLKKTKQYQSRAKFVREKKEVLDEESYLKTIQLQPAIEPINSTTILRAEQLCAKTNQFNLRPVRHTAVELQQLALNNPDFCFLISLSDVYGDHGIVGLVCMREIGKQTLFLDTFLQSCRVLGRHLESWMLQHALNVGRQNGYTALIGEFISTKRNKIAADFLEAHGFEPLNNASSSKWGANNAMATYDEAFSSGSKRFIRPLSETKLPFVDVYEKS